MDQKLSRDQLQQLLNRINENFQADDLEAKKNNMPTIERDAMRAKRTDMENKVKAKYGDDLHKLDAGGKINVGNSTVTPGTSQGKLVDMASTPGLGKQGLFKKTLGSIGKKVAGVIPLAGVGMAALNGDPAMAAEELASDAAGPAGMVYEALKPDVAGNPEEEKQMLVERNAMDKYKQSPAGQASKLAKLKNLMGK